jgi:hypothetical protein
VRLRRPAGASQAARAAAGRRACGCARRAPLLGGACWWGRRAARTGGAGAGGAARGGRVKSEGLQRDDRTQIGALIVGTARQCGRGRAKCCGDRGQRPKAPQRGLPRPGGGRNFVIAPHRAHTGRLPANSLWGATALGDRGARPQSGARSSGRPPSKRRCGGPGPPGLHDLVGSARGPRVGRCFRPAGWSGVRVMGACVSGRGHSAPGRTALPRRLPRRAPPAAGAPTARARPASDRRPRQPAAWRRRRAQGRCVPRALLPSGPLPLLVLLRRRRRRAPGPCLRWGLGICPSQALSVPAEASARLRPAWISCVYRNGREGASPQNTARWVGAGGWMEGEGARAGAGRQRPHTKSAHSQASSGGAAGAGAARTRAHPRAGHARERDGGAAGNQGRRRRPLRGAGPGRRAPAAQLGARRPRARAAGKGRSRARAAGAGAGGGCEGRRRPPGAAARPPPRARTGRWGAGGPPRGGGQKLKLLLTRRRRCGSAAAARGAVTPPLLPLLPAA